MKLDRVLIVPARDPVHKKIYEKVTPYERLEMVRLAISGNDYFESSSIEIDRDEASYTQYTLNQLKEIYTDDEFYLIIGSDSFNELDTWKSFTEILKSTNIVVIHRPGASELRRDLIELASNVRAVENPEINISSTEIRERVKLGKSIKYLVPDGVIDYINFKGLYRN
jgi:nicotinate-nucleotide adenylyltransferase